MINNRNNNNSSLPLGVKIAIGVGIVVVALIIAKKVKKFVSKTGSVIEDKTTLNTQSSEINQLKDAGIKQTYPDSQYRTWADTIYNNVSGCNNDYSLIPLNIIKRLVNDVDWIKLSKEFGTRDVKGCGFASNRQCTLPVALNWKLSDDSLALINLILKSRSSKYRI